MNPACFTFEVHGAVLQPFRHKGEANYLNGAEPGPLFATLADAPAAR